MNQKIPEQIHLIYSRKEDYGFRYDFVFSTDYRDWIVSKSKKYDNKEYRRKLTERKESENK
jgi:hypothetical protein